MSLDPTERAAIRAEILREQKEAFDLAMATRRRLDAARKERADELEVHWAEQFSASAKKLATDHHISIMTAQLILASIAAGEVPNFRTSFYDEL